DRSCLSGTSATGDSRDQRWLQSSGTQEPHQADQAPGASDCAGTGSEAGEITCGNVREFVPGLLAVVSDQGAGRKFAAAADRLRRSVSIAQSECVVHAQSRFRGGAADTRETQGTGKAAFLWYRDRNPAGRSILSIGSGHFLGATRLWAARSRGAR